MTLDRSVSAMTSAPWCRSYTEAERQHLFRVSRLFITCYYMYLGYYGLLVLDVKSIDHPAFSNIGTNWQWKCISVWNFILQVSYFMYCTIFIDYADSGPGKTWRQPHVQNHKKIRDFTFVSLLFPITIVVCTMFWAICAVNRPLLFPKELNNWIPDWYNHAVHTNPIVLALFEMVTTKHNLPKITKSTTGLFTVTSAYILCLLYGKYTTGRWIYLIIHDIAPSLMEKIIFFGVTAYIIPFVCMAIGFKMCSWFSNQQIIEELKMS